MNGAMGLAKVNSYFVPTYQYDLKVGDGLNHKTNHGISVRREGKTSQSTRNRHRSLR